MKAFAFALALAGVVLAIPKSQDAANIDKNLEILKELGFDPDASNAVFITCGVSIKIGEGRIRAASDASIERMRQTT